MTVESANYIGQLDPTKPTYVDDKREGDDHLRLIKTVLQTQWPSIGTTAVTVTGAQLNEVINKAIRAGDAYTGAHDFTGATLTGATQTVGDSTTKAATTAFVANAIAALSGMSIDLTLNITTGASVTAAVGGLYVLTYAGLVTVTTPTSPTAGNRFGVIVANDRVDNLVAYGSDKIMSLAESLTLDSIHTSIQLRYISTTVGWRIE